MRISYASYTHLISILDLCSFTYGMLFYAPDAKWALLHHISVGMPLGYMYIPRAMQIER